MKPKTLKPVFSRRAAGTLAAAGLILTLGFAPAAMADGANNAPANNNRPVATLAAHVSIPQTGEKKDAYRAARDGQQVVFYYGGDWDVVAQAAQNIMTRDGIPTSIMGGGDPNTMMMFVGRGTPQEFDRDNIAGLTFQAHVVYNTRIRGMSLEDAINAVPDYDTVAASASARDEAPVVTAEFSAPSHD